MRRILLTRPRYNPSAFHSFTFDVTPRRKIMCPDDSFLYTVLHSSKRFYINQIRYNQKYRFLIQRSIVHCSFSVCYIFNRNRSIQSVKFICLCELKNNCNDTVKFKNRNPNGKYESGISFNNKVLFSNDSPNLK